MSSPYYQDDYITIYHDDCQEYLLTTLPVDCVITDIPYNLSIEGNGLRELYYGEWDQDFSLDIIGRLVELTRKSIYVWCHETQISDILKAYRQEKLIDRCLSWIKPNPTVLNGDKLWLPGLELCAFGKQPGAEFHEHCKSGVWITSPDSDRLHPNQKPLSIITQQIAASSSEFDIILDPFMGSGTTLRAAKNLHRQAIGIEQDEKWCEVAAKRMEQGVLPYAALEVEPQQLRLGDG